MAPMKERCDTTEEDVSRGETRDGRPIDLFLLFDFVHVVPLVPETDLAVRQQVAGWPECPAASEVRTTSTSACARGD